MNKNNEKRNDKDPVSREKNKPVDPKAIPPTPTPDNPKPNSIPTIKSD